MGTETIRLLREWQDGDRQVLDRLLQRHLGWLGHYVRRRMGPELRHGEESQDVVQESLIDLLACGPGPWLSDARQLRKLLARIVENNIRDRQRWLHRGCRDVGREGGRSPDAVPAEAVPVESPTRPSQAASENERLRWVRFAVELLKPTDREVVSLRAWRGLTFAEIGERLGISENAARMRYARAVERLALKIAELRRGRAPVIVAGA